MSENINYFDCDGRLCFDSERRAYVINSPTFRVAKGTPVAIKDLLFFLIVDVNGPMVNPVEPMVD